MTDADLFISEVRRRGSDAHDLRDAAHESFHAMVAKIRAPWDRERIHAGLLRTPIVRSFARAGLIAHELDARSVERVVCARFGVEYDLNFWSTVAVMETVKTTGVGIDLTWWIAEIEKRSAQAGCYLAARSLIRRILGTRRATKILLEGPPR